MPLREGEVFGAWISLGLSMAVLAWYMTTAHAADGEVVLMREVPPRVAYRMAAPGPVSAGVSLTAPVVRGVDAVRGIEGAIAGSTESELSDTEAAGVAVGAVESPLRNLTDAGRSMMRSGSGAGVDSGSALNNGLAGPGSGIGHAVGGSVNQATGRLGNALFGATAVPRAGQ